MSVHQKVGFLNFFFFPKVSSAACGLPLPGQGVFWDCACLAAAAVGELLAHLPCRADFRACSQPSFTLL